MGLIKPFLKWAGGKSRLVPELLKHVPDRFGTYHEPFVGGGALFFALRPSVAVLSDSNPELIQTYEAVRDSVERVIACLRTMPHDPEFFYALRDEPEPLFSTNVWTAARFIYLNRTCFNGLYRVNKAGKFNVPFGSYANPVVCDVATLRDCSKLLRRAHLSSGDFEYKHFAPGDFVYFDPPYVPVSKTSNFTSYSATGFGEADQQRLAALALRLKRAGVHVLLSNSDCPAVRQLYSSGFEFERVEVRRSINSDKNGRGPCGELIFW